MKKIVTGLMTVVFLFCGWTVPGHAKEELACLKTPIIRASDYGVGVGKSWPRPVLAPYFNMGTYVRKEGYHYKGAPNLVAFAEDTGFDYFNLGFIQGVFTESDRIHWGWAGYGELSEGSTDPQYLGIKRTLKEFRESGRDFTVSFGGAKPTAFWQMTEDVDVLVNTYREIIQGYGLTRIDLDIEGTGTGYAKNKVNAKAIKRIQEETGVQVTLTLPVMPQGLIKAGQDDLRAYLEEGVQLELINIMTMCYGGGVTDYVQASKEAVENTKEQVKHFFHTYQGITLTEEQAYQKIGSTPLIGARAGHPTFTQEQMKELVAHAREKKIGQLAFWSVGRDAQIENQDGMIEPLYSYSPIANGFLRSEPVTVRFETAGGSRITDQTIEKGEKLSRPADPVKDGFTFQGWYKDAAHTEAWDFSQPVMSDLILYGKWEAKTPPQQTKKGKTDKRTNNFQIGNLEAELVEAFESEKGIELNSPVKKEVAVKNTGSIPQFVRVMIHPEIVQADGTILPSKIGKVIHLDISNEWQAGGDGFYYYKGRLESKDTTPNLFTTVRLDSGLSAEYKDAALELQLKVEAAGTTTDSYRDTWWRGENPTTGELGGINQVLSGLQ
ncbi:hypothetical protein NRIC_35880 [Enterococcus florum]|uniref:GH18 domain-containing protein n=1 Tax=Enterococcus florum TaxID=2480627 RepID=A0A4P5PBY0_9ENTE|nr:InlB B-repeat-containing protein [Enterococcus florum]GCF95697.1 hypothetical protein NRIC_35880 [Enterococcus florum]